MRDGRRGRQAGLLVDGRDELRAVRAPVARGRLQADRVGPAAGQVVVGAGPCAEVRGRLLGHLDDALARRARLRRDGRALLARGEHVRDALLAQRLPLPGAGPGLADHPRRRSGSRRRPSGAGAPTRAETDMQLATRHHGLARETVLVDRHLAGAALSRRVEAAGGAERFSPPADADARRPNLLGCRLRLPIGGGADDRRPLRQVNLVIRAANVASSSGQASTIVRQPARRFVSRTRRSRGPPLLRSVRSASGPPTGRAPPTCAATVVGAFAALSVVRRPTLAVTPGTYRSARVRRG